jgi:hypothetical protein
MQAKFDQNTTLTLKNRTKIVLYNELFTTHKDQKILKLNLVTKIPNDIILKIKKEYNEYIKTCFEKHEIIKTNGDKPKKRHMKIKKTKFFRKK